ncbi:hypothetical protein H310_01498 [Aphanomyces invadans]|uniref:Expansin-like EG45 domain-containing protein n=1 Tax=Aphanomyces invadans TaxID=157072 RepID=A0A024USV0_9STRA|nr:hypothetical protein H310_01498 [Aphanomyces invadans]ETW09030.1 hypothetical protein H310_01498 [Aphanomyces invadans]|eukprot:XP_008862835.1 hypothetical protein H310_01498 [Aphanomyces invadans]
MLFRQVVLAATATTLAVHAATTYSGLSSTYGGPDGVEASTGNCAPMNHLPTATKYHVAMNDKQYNEGLNCGRCVQVQCTDSRCTSNKVMTAQVTDRCPECSHGDLDMTLPLFNELTGHFTDKYKIEWQFVDCPVSGGVQVCAKEGSSKFWLYVQPMNTVSGVKEMKVNGGAAPPFLPCFYFMTTKLGVELEETEVEMTSWAGETIKTKVALQAGACTQISQQFTRGLPTFDPSDPNPPPPSPSPTNPPPAPSTSSAKPSTSPAPTPPPETTEASTTTTVAPTSATTVVPTSTTTSPHYDTEAATTTNNSTNSTTDTTTVPVPPTTAPLTDSADATTLSPAFTDAPTTVPTSVIGGTENVVSVQASSQGDSDSTPYVVLGSGMTFVMAVMAVVYVVKKSRSNYMDEKESESSQITRFGQADTRRNLDSDVVML